MDSLRSSNEQSLRSHAAHIERAKQQLSVRLAELDRRSPAKDAAEVVALREAVESLKATQQRFAGKFYKQLQLDEATSSASSPLNGLDPELAAELALQSAPSAGPGSK